MFTEKKESWAEYADFLILDLVCLTLGLFFAYAARFGHWNFWQDSDYRRLLIMHLVFQVIITYSFAIYDKTDKRGYLKEFVAVGKNIALLVLIESGTMFILKSSEHFSRLVVFLSALFSLFLMYFTHILWKKLRVRRYTSKKNCRKIVVVTQRQFATRCALEWKQHTAPRYDLVGLVLTDWSGEAELEGIPVLGGEAELFEYARTHVLDDALLYRLHEKNGVIMDSLVNMGIVTHRVLDQFSRSDFHLDIQEVNGFVTVTAGIGSMTMVQKFCKRAVDIIVGFLGSLATLVLMLAFTPVIKKQAPGPVFFKQKRVGRNGRTFYMYKFRSMYADAEARKQELMAQNQMSGLMFKMEDDPRIFPFGHFLRKSSLDEFPQFFNVLKGDMSFCGTRPPTVDEFDQYELHHKSRLAMRPGITGLWQVSGRSAITDFEDVVRLDNQYIRNWSFSLDLKIMLKTVAVVFLRKGAE